MMSVLTPPSGRYGRAPSAAARRRAVVTLWLLGIGGLLTAVWLGVGVARSPVTWQDVSFSVGPNQVEVVYDVARPNPSLAVRCRIEARNSRHAQVGVVTVAVPPGDRVVRVTTVVNTAEPAVTGLVDSCWVEPD